MKKHRYLYILAAISMLAVTALAHAQTPNDGQKATLPPTNASGMNEQRDIQTGQPGKPTTIRARLQSDYKTGMTNLEYNRDYRNGLIDGRYSSSSQPSASGTPPFRRDFNATSTDRFGRSGMIPLLMKRFATSTTFASSTLMRRLIDNHQNEKGIRADVFAYLQGNLVQQSDQALTNLQQISSRISSLIQTETAKGLNMTKATSLLTTANTDISMAEQAIQALSSYAPATNPSNLTASTTISLGQARKLGSTVISSIDIVRKDLDKVVNAIIQGMGIPPTGTSTEAAPPAE